MNESSYPKKWDTSITNANFVKWAESKVANIMTFRDKTFTSPNTMVTSLPTKVKWFDNHNDTVEHFLDNGDADAKDDASLGKLQNDGIEGLKQ